MSIEQLMIACPAPIHPNHTGNEAEWKFVESEIGGPLPKDYKQLIDVYGTGKFSDFLKVSSPFDHRRGLLTDKDWILSAYRQQQEMLPQSSPYSIYPSEGGLLPCGNDENGGVIYWRTKGKTDEWTLVYNPHHIEFEEINESLTEFLANWLSGKTKYKSIPEEFGPEATLYSGKNLFTPIHLYS